MLKCGVRPVPRHQRNTTVESLQLKRETERCFLNTEVRCPALAATSAQCDVESPFDVPFSFKMTRSDTVHAFLAYFSVVFASGQKVSVTMHTGPSDTPTHWKQTVFYLRDDISVTEGDEISGTLACQPTIANRRFLDINIKFRHILTSTNTPAGCEVSLEYTMQ